MKQLSLVVGQRYGRIIAVLLFVAVSATFMLIGDSGQYSYAASSVDATKVEPVPNVILVKVKPAERAELQNNTEETETGVASIDTTFQQKSKRIEAEKIAPDAGKSKAQDTLSRWTKITVKNPGKKVTDNKGNVRYPDVDTIIAELKRDPSVEAVEKDTVMQISATTNDPYMSTSGNILAGMDDLWGIKAIRAPQAWDMTTGAGVTVGVIDTGVDLNHPDLSANAWVNPDEIASNGIDDDGNGYVDDVHGWNFYDNNSSTVDVHSHGTHVAGTVAAAGNNGVGVAGVAYRAKIMALQACNAEGKCSTSATAAAINYAVNMGAKVTNNSYGGPGSSSLQRDAIKYAHANNVATIAATGNDSEDVIQAMHYPSNDENVIAVSASTHTNALASFSNFGAKVDVVAPGNLILSLGTTGVSSYVCPAYFTSLYCYKSGTSMASPHVAGIVALMYSRNPSLTVDQIRQILRSTATDLGTAGFDTTFGYGLAQANASVTASTSPAVLEPHITAPFYDAYATGTVNIRGYIRGQNVASYVLQMGVGASPSSWTQLASGSGAVPSEQTLATINSYNYTNGYYSFRLVATDTTNRTYVHDVFDVYMYSNADTTAPTMPGGLTATPGEREVTLDWTASTDSQSGVQGYIVKRNGVTVATPTDTTYTDTGLLSGTSYTYSVQAYDVANNISSAATMTVSTLVDTTLPTVTFTSPVSGAIVSKSVTVSLNITNPERVASVKLYRDSTLVTTLSAAPFKADISVITLSDGVHSLRAVVTCTDGATVESLVDVEVANPRRGDLNDDTIVNIFDLSVLLSKWNQTSITHDLDGNGLVNIFDLSILLYEYGK